MALGTANSVQCSKARQQAQGKDARVLTARQAAGSRKRGAARLAPTLGLMLAWTLVGAGACPSRDEGWRGYYYGDVLSSAPAQVSGPYDSAPRCIAAMHALLRRAPTTASFTCARACHAASDGSLEDCREVAR
jgi:hypothetical protein